MRKKIWVVCGILLLLGWIVSADKIFGVSTAELTLGNFRGVPQMPSDAEVVRIANQMLAGKLIVNADAFKEPLLYSSAHFDWNVQYTNSPNTYQLYLQSLQPLAYLSKAYELTGNSAYLVSGEAFLRSWICYKNDKKLSEKNPFLWYDHGTALRAENIIYFLLSYERALLLKPTLRRELDALLYEHGAFLSEEKHYTKNHNHGIFQDRALLHIAYFLRNEHAGAWVKLSRARIQEQFDYAFNDEMVHVENSPGYQIGVMGLFMDISDLLTLNEDPFGEEIADKISLAAEFMAYVVKPNGYVAAIGDTNSRSSEESLFNETVSLHVFQNPHLTYAATQGKEGEKPEKRAKFYPKSGYYLSRSSWEKAQYVDATWVMFKAGYTSRTHKHADDLSFMLYSKGTDIFVDTGWYNYMIGDPYRDYFISANAHNTVIVDGKTYSPIVENRDKTGILEFDENEKYDYVLGFNEMYSGVSIDRHFYYLRDNAILIYDNIKSKEKHIYSQLFHLGEKLKIIAQSSNEIVAQIGNSGYKVRIRQLGQDALASVLTESTKEPLYGNFSSIMNLVEPIHTLKFDIYADNADFVTLVTIENEGEGPDIQAKYDQSTKDVHISAWGGDIYLHLSERQRSLSDRLYLYKEGDLIRGVDKMQQQGDVFYDWHVTAKNAETSPYESGYSRNSSFQYVLDSAAEYLVECDVKDKWGYVKRNFVGIFRREAQTGTYEPIASDSFSKDFVFRGQKMRITDQHVYEFLLDYDYYWDTNVKWYIYKNGGYYASFHKKNNKSLQYDFTEPGTYTVIYYLKAGSRNGEFRNFPQIVIGDKSKE